MKLLEIQTSVTPEPKPDRTEGRFVDLAQRVTAIYYDDEHEDFLEKTVTIEDLLCPCDHYTVVTLPEPQRKTGKWIPITQREPDTKNDYLVSIRGTTTGWVSIASYDGEDWCMMEPELTAEDITAWMPLPEAFREGRE